MSACLHSDQTLGAHTDNPDNFTLQMDGESLPQGSLRTPLVSVHAEMFHLVTNTQTVLFHC